MSFQRLLCAYETFKRQEAFYLHNEKNGQQHARALARLIRAEERISREIIKEHQRGKSCENA